MICPLCKGDFPEDTFSEINNEGTKGCPRCIFLIALYIENGIKKHLTEGCLMPDRINARFRKILEGEFYQNPAATYKKYLAGMIDREEAELRIIYLPTAEIRKIQNDWPFVLLTPEQAEKYKPVPGANLTVRDEKITTEIRRRIYATHVLNKRQAAKYGMKTRATACFIPPPEYDTTQEQEDSKNE